MRAAFVAFVSLFLLAAALPSQGAVQFFHTSDSQFDPGVDNQGWWSATTSNYDSNDNYITGRDGSNLFRSFFTFDLSSLSGTVVAAELTLRRFSFVSTDPTETLEFFEVTTPAAALNSNDGRNAIIFDDLGSGVSYGAFVLSVATTPDIVSFTLNADAIAAINAAQGGFFSIGGSLVSISGSQYIFGNSGDPDPQTLTLITADIGHVPEPGSLIVWGMLGTAACVCVRYRRRRQLKSAGATVFDNVHH